MNIFSSLVNMIIDLFYFLFYNYYTSKIKEW